MKPRYLIVGLLSLALLSALPRRADARGYHPGMTPDTPSYPGRYPGGGSNQPTDVGHFLSGFWYLFAPVVTVFMLILNASVRRTVRDSPLNPEPEFLFSSATLESKAEKTEKLLSHLAARDSLVDPAAWKAMTAETFVKLQQCWEARNYIPMRPLLTPELYHSHDLQLVEMSQQHEINHIADLKVYRVDLVHVRYTVRRDQREFTALITASARDYVTDDRTGQIIRGDRSPFDFQEVWFFCLRGQQWVVRDIEQSLESQAIGESNVVEGMSEAEMCRITGAPLPLPIPKPAPEAPAKRTEIDMLVEKLAASNPVMWDSAALTSRARELFTETLQAEESLAISPALSASLLEPAASVLHCLIADHQENGQTIQYQNLRVDKVELIVANHLPDHSSCEYVARVVAHARKTMHRPADSEHLDPHEMPLVKFLTFGWAGGKWKLKEFRAAA